MLNSRSAAVLSIALCLPFLLVILGVTFFPEEPAFLRPFSERMVAPDGTTTSFGVVVMFVLLFSLPAAFVINLVSMFTRSAPAPFQPTRAHVVTGMAILILLALALRQGVLHELRPFVRPLGPAAFVGQAVCMLALLPLPAMFLLNRLSGLASAVSGGGLAIRPTSINLIVGAAIMMVIFLIASTFMLEEIACQIGVPNCD